MNCSSNIRNFIVTPKSLSNNITYAVFGDVTWVEGLLFGLQAAVVAIVIEAVIRIGKRTLRSRALQVTAAVSFVAIAFGHIPFPYIVIVAALAGWLARRDTSL